MIGYQRSLPQKKLEASGFFHYFHLVLVLLYNGYSLWMLESSGDLTGFFILISLISTSLIYHSKPDVMNVALFRSLSHLLISLSLGITLILGMLTLITTDHAQIVFLALFLFYALPAAIVNFVFLILMSVSEEELKQKYFIVQQEGVMTNLVSENNPPFMKNQGCNSQFEEV